MSAPTPLISDRNYNQTRNGQASNDLSPGPHTPEHISTHAAASAHVPPRLLVRRYTRVPQLTPPTPTPPTPHASGPFGSAHELESTEHLPETPQPARLLPRRSTGARQSNALTHGSSLTLADATASPAAFSLSSSQDSLGYSTVAGNKRSITDAEETGNDNGDGLKKKPKSARPKTKDVDDLTRRSVIMHACSNFRLLIATREPFPGVDVDEMALAAWKLACSIKEYEGVVILSDKELWIVGICFTTCLSSLTYQTTL